MTRRKPREGEIICRCNAYKFPHRLTSGRCTGRIWVAKLWSENYGSGVCSDCRYCSEQDYSKVCEVMEGQEPAHQCPEFQQYLDYESVPVPKSIGRKAWS